MRLTERTLAVLVAVGERPGANNRQVAADAGASEPQISRLLPRLAEHGLVENRGGVPAARSKSWWLTASGAELLGGVGSGRAPGRPRLAGGKAGGRRGGRQLALEAAPVAGSRLRMTYRTALVLEAIAQAPGLSNLGVARHAQVNDQGQISKLLARLQRHGLVQNTGRGQGQGGPNEWRLTPAGQKLERSIREHAGSHGKRAAA